MTTQDRAAFYDWYNTTSCEPSYQEAFEAGWQAALQSHRIADASKMISEFKIADLAIKHLGSYAEKDYDFVMAVLREALQSQAATIKESLPVQAEPVAEIINATEVDGNGVLTHLRDIDFYQEDIDALPAGTKLYRTPPATQSAWIPVSERLPEIGECVLGAIKHTYTNAAPRYAIVMMKRFGHNDWGDYYAPTHWMPLPKPPEAA